MVRLNNLVLGMTLLFGAMVSANTDETPVQVNGAYWVHKQGQYLPGNNDDKTEGLSLEECLERCINMAVFECKSAEYVQSKQMCIISRSNRDNVGPTRTSGNIDYYERVEVPDNLTKPATEPTITTRPGLYPNPRDDEVPMQMKGAYWARKQEQYLPGNNDDKTEGLSLEECLERCINMAAFECKSAEYVQSKQMCIISRSNRDDVGSTRASRNMDYYERVEFSDSPGVTSTPTTRPSTGKPTEPSTGKPTEPSTAKPTTAKTQGPTNTPAPTPPTDQKGCSSSPCMNGASCEPRRGLFMTQDGRDFDCTCPDEFEGDFCEKKKTDCNLVECPVFKCKEGVTLFTPPGECCQRCGEDCSAVRCANVEKCDDGSLPLVPPGRCCPQCPTPATPTPPPPAFCVYEGRRYPFGDFKTRNPCLHCSCMEEGVMCYSITCDVPECADNTQPIVKDGECCPSCPDKPDSMKLQVTGNLVNSMTGMGMPNVPVSLGRMEMGGGHTLMGMGNTDDMGYVTTLRTKEPLERGRDYFLYFSTEYSFEYVQYPFIQVFFRHTGQKDMYHFTVVAGRFSYSVNQLPPMSREMISIILENMPGKWDDDKNDDIDSGSGSGFDSGSGLDSGSGFDSGSGSGSGLDSGSGSGSELNSGSGSGPGSG